MIARTTNLSRSGGTGFFIYGFPKLPVPKDDLWPCNWIISQITWSTAMRPDRTDVVPIHATWWSRVLTRKYRRYLQALLDIGAVERVGGYEVGNHPFSYRLIPPYNQPMLLECPDRWLIQRVVRASKDRLPIITHIEKWSRRLGIDERGAMEAAKSLTPRRQFADVQQRDWATEQLRQAMRWCIRIIADGWAGVLWDDCHGRVYPPHAGLHRKLRRYLWSPDGERIVGWDVKNCQPLLDALLAAQYYHPDRSRRSRLLRRPLDPSTNPYLVRQLITAGEPLRVANGTSVSAYKNRGETQFGKHIERSSRYTSPPSLPAGVSSCPADRCPPEWFPASCLLWLEAAENGGIYEEFQDLYRDDREATKAAWPAVHYGKAPLHLSPIGRRIEQRFPAMAQVIDAMRYKNYLLGKDSRPYRYLACMLQLYESTVMIGMVCARIMREKPDCPLWPIHDCILTTEPYQEYVLRVLRQEFARVGLFPQFHPLEVDRD